MISPTSRLCADPIRASAVRLLDRFMLRKASRLLPYATAQWPTLAAILVLTVISALATVLQPWPLKLLIDHALGDAPSPASVEWIARALSVEADAVLLVVLAGLASFGLFLLGAALNFGLSWTWTAAGQRMVYDLAGQLFARLQRLSLLFHSRRSVGDSLDRLSTDSWCVYTVTEGLLATPMQQAVTLCALATAAWMLDPLLAMLSLTAAPALAAVARFFGARLKQRTRLQREAQSRLTGFVHQTLTALPLAQAFGTEDRNRQRFRELAETAVSTGQRVVLLNGTAGMAAGMTNALGTALVLLAGGWRVLAGGLTVGSLIVFIAYLKSMQSAFEKLFQTYTKLKSAEASIDRVFEVLDAAEIVHDAPTAVPLPARSPQTSGHVRFENVSFGYDADRPVLHGVTLEVEPGETVALVGPTGAGKSTLVSLVPRFFDPQAGRVLFDGFDVRDVQLASLRSQVALVLQEPFLLPLTVAENIAYGRPDAPRAQVEAAARAANADEFIRRLPQGYDTVIGERGATLSGGQKQRLAIARALLKDAPVVILDEPTSALDTETESLVFEALERLTAGRTTLIIAHRLSTIRRADRVVVLDEGRIVETGTHRQLLASGGLYADLHGLQFVDSPLEVGA